MSEQPIADILDSDERDTLIAEARALRRRVAFWQRTAFLAVSLVVIVAVLLWLRNASYGNRCRNALVEYARLAVEADLASVTADLREAQWRGLQSETAAFSPGYFWIIAQNWDKTAREGERIPLAICRTPHRDVLAQGRYVLMRETSGDRVEWIPEADAGPILKLVAAEHKWESFSD